MLEHLPPKKIKTNTIISQTRDCFIYSAIIIKHFSKNVKSCFYSYTIMKGGDEIGEGRNLHHLSHMKQLYAEIMEKL